MTSENGILARVPGQYIAAGGADLPAAGPEQESQPVRHVVVDDVPDLGAVRITYRLNSYRQGRSRRWHWLAVRADPDADAGPNS